MVKKLNIIPILISAILSVGIYFLSSKLGVVPDFEKFLEIFITAFSILIGFLFTTATILNSYRNEKLDFIRKSGGMKSMYLSLRKSIYSGFLAIFFSIVYFLFQPYLQEFVLITYFIIGFNILAMIFCVGFTKLFLEIIATE